MEAALGLDLGSLLSQLTATQQAQSAAKLSERNVVELINKLRQLGILSEGELLHTLNGKEYMTVERLRAEVQKALRQAGGRLALVELPTIVGVDLIHCERQVAAIIAQSAGTVQEVNGELITTQYLDTIASEINDQLQESGQINVGELAAQYGLATELVMNVVTSRLGTVIQGASRRARRPTHLAGLGLCGALYARRRGEAPHPAARHRWRHTGAAGGRHARGGGRAGPAPNPHHPPPAPGPPPPSPPDLLHAPDTLPAPLHPTSALHTLLLAKTAPLFPLPLSPSPLFPSPPLIPRPTGGWAAVHAVLPARYQVTAAGGAEGRHGARAGGGTAERGGRAGPGGGGCRYQLKLKRIRCKRARRSKGG